MRYTLTGVSNGRDGALVHIISWKHNDRNPQTLFLFHPRQHGDHGCQLQNCIKRDHLIFASLSKSQAKTNKGRWLSSKPVVGLPIQKAKPAGGAFPCPGKLGAEFLAPCQIFEVCGTNIRLHDFGKELKNGKH